MAGSEQTPMMRQYHAIRRDLPEGTILLFRLGDFYEMFGDDAREAAGILNVALTKRAEMPMCGVPFHAAKGYIEKLIAAGRRVAICDQVGDVQAGKLVRRELTRILSAGTLDDFGLDDKAPNRLAAVCQGRSTFGLAYCDLSTGEFCVSELPTTGALMDEVSRVAPVETLVPDHQHSAFAALPAVAPVEGYVFDPAHARELLESHFGVHSLDGFGCSGLDAAVGAAGALVHYLSRQMRRDIGHLKRLRVHHPGDHLVLDAATQTHLELVTSRGGRGMTLLACLDRTVTPMGARLIRDWVLRPLRRLETIVERQEAIAALRADPFALGRLRDTLGEVRDIERAAGRLSGNSGGPRDLAALGTSLARLPALAATCATIDSPLVRSLADSLDPVDSLRDLLSAALVDEPPALVREGGMVREGYDPILDELRSGSRAGKDWIAGLQEREIARTGIKSLKVRFTSVFGYFIEITKANLSAVPDDYVRRQTTVNGERFVTPELKDIEGKILGADERARAREIEIFQELRRAVLDALDAIQSDARAVAALDALGSLADVARAFDHCRPVVDDSLGFDAVASRHPVLDQQTTAERFVPNDIALDAEGGRFAIITGPNMAGKSTYIRQAALLMVMAQMGACLPAASARVGIADRIFTRVGASDDITRGQSTFMVEMNETANILNNATHRSLVILDEIGRGTSTFDGLSIAWSVAEFLHDTVQCRTLFATHYHELTDLERTRPGIINLNVAVREWNDQVVFLRKILPGRADQSYGIQVARLAGLPNTVLTRAKEILANLESAELNAEGKPALAEPHDTLTRARRKRSALQTGINQMDLL